MNKICKNRMETTGTGLTRFTSNIDIEKMKYNEKSENEKFIRERHYESI